MGVIAAFGLVFLLLGLSLRTLKRVHDGGAGRSGLRMEVVQRLAVGPKQGIAVVRIGERLVAVSLGEGGVRPLLELGEQERETVAAAALLPAQPIVTVPGLQLLLGKKVGGIIERGLSLVGIRPTSVALPSGAAAVALASGPEMLRAEAPESNRTSAAPAAGESAPIRPDIGIGAVPTVAQRSPLPDAAPATALNTTLDAEPKIRPTRETAASELRIEVAAPISMPESMGSPATDSMAQDAIAARAAALRQRHSPIRHRPLRGTGTAELSLRREAKVVESEELVQTGSTAGKLGVGAAREGAAPAAGRSFGSILRQVAAERVRTAVGAAPRIAIVVLLAVGMAAVADIAIASAQASAEVASGIAQADTMLTRLAPEIDVRVGDAAGGLRLSGTVGVVVMMGLLTLLPTLILMMTSFTRIFIVLGFLRQALGTQSAPPSHLMAALALLLTGFIMAPTLSEVNSTALEPWMDGQIDQAQMLSTASVPFRSFMLGETRDNDLQTFLDMSQTPEVERVEDVPMVVLMSAFVTSELRTAFQIGFALFLPFIVIDIVVASVLMSMGMMMLPPPMIALPFKILLFVLVDGWTLIVQGLVSSFH